MNYEQEIRPTPAIVIGDDGRKIADSYKFIGTPFTVLVSKESHIVERRAGPQSEKALREKIEKLLK